MVYAPVRRDNPRFVSPKYKFCVSTYFFFHILYLNSYSWHTNALSFLKIIQYIIWDNWSKLVQSAVVLMKVFFFFFFFFFYNFLKKCMKMKFHEKKQTTKKKKKQKTKNKENKQSFIIYSIGGACLCILC